MTYRTPAPYWKKSLNYAFGYGNPPYPNGPLRRPKGYTYPRYKRGYRKRRRSRRRYYRKKRAAQGLYYYTSKHMARRRSNLGLPPVEVKKIEQISTITTNWIAFAADTFSYLKLLSTIPIGESEETRTSNDITILPFTYWIGISQPADQEYYYRILTLKIVGQSTHTDDIEPQNIFESYSSAEPTTRSPYQTKEDRSFNFIVLRDKRYTINTYSGNGTLMRYIPVKFTRRHHVKYDPDDTTGATTEGGIYICIVTNAPTTGAYYHGGKFTMSFLDM